jgi:hypothetical protein
VVCVQTCLFEKFYETSEVSRLEKFVEIFSNDATWYTYLGVTFDLELQPIPNPLSRYEVKRKSFIFRILFNIPDQVRRILYATTLISEVEENLPHNYYRSLHQCSSILRSRLSDTTLVEFCSFNRDSTSSWEITLGTLS